jgi:hypothetical protein
MYKLTVFILIVLIILSGYLYLSVPERVVVNEKGRVEGLMNKGRALVQGDKFWESQLKLANDRYRKSLEPQVPSSSEMQKLYHKLAEDENALNEKMKALYSPEEQMANTFRMKADSLERAGKWRLIDEAQVKANNLESEKFKIIIPIIESKLKIKKQQDPATTDTKLNDKPAL